MRLFFAVQVVVLSALLLAVFYYQRVFQITLSNISIEGFDWTTYHAPSYSFAICAFVSCSLTVGLGWGIHRRLPVVSSLFLLMGLSFMLLSIVMLTMPRYINISDVFYYWCAFIASNVILTLWADLLYQRPEVLEGEEEPYSDVLDHLGPSD